MRAHLFLIVTLLFNATWLCVFSLSESNPKLPLEFVHNAGILPPGLNYDVNFQLINNTKSSLTLGRARASCGCIATDVSSKVVPVGSIFEIPVHLRASNREKNVRERVMIELNDGPHPFLAFILEANVRKPISLDIGSAKHIVVSAENIERSIVLNLNNYSNKKWSKLEGYGPPGLKVASSRASAAGASGLVTSEPVEVWRIEFSLEKGHHLRVGETGKILLIASPSDAAMPFTEVIDLKFM
jgi:hypothetical protein